VGDSPVTGDEHLVNIDHMSADELEAGLAEAQAGMGG
jgi:hypothetical protein